MDTEERLLARRSAEDDGRDKSGRFTVPGWAWVRTRLKIGEGAAPTTFAEHAVVFAKELLVVVVIAAIVSTLVRGFVAQMFLIPSASMENALIRKDRVMVEKLTPVQRGEVVVFKDPGGWISSPQPGRRGSVGQALQFVGLLPDASVEHLVKRVVGLPGDHIICCDDQQRITVNGQALDETSYLFRAADGTQVAPSATHWDVIVPARHYFVLGDRRDASRDSRCHLDDPNDADPATPGADAFVDTDRIVGRARSVLWPSNRIHSLRIPASYATVPAPTDPAPAAAVINVRPETPC